MGESQTWERYVESWKAGSETEKKRLFATCLAPACVYTDPLAVANGWEELAQYMLEFHKQVPGGHFVTEHFIAHHGRSIARWRMVAADGTTLGDGISYAEYDEHGRLKEMTGFFDPPGAAT